MLAKLKTFSLLGIDAVPVEVEVDVSSAALPKVVFVGLPEQAVKESTHHVERALVNSGFVRPQNRVVVNLAPPAPVYHNLLSGGWQYRQKEWYCYIGGIVNLSYFSICFENGRGTNHA